MLGWIFLILVIAALGLVVYEAAKNSWNWQKAIAGALMLGAAALTALAQLAGGSPPPAG